MSEIPRKPHVQNKHFVGARRHQYVGHTKILIMPCPYDRIFDLLLWSSEQADLERQRAEQERQRAEQERQRADVLAAKLRELGVDPDRLT